MITICKTITDPMKASTKRRVAHKARSSNSEDIGGVMRRDQEAQATLAELRQAISEGLKSGVSGHSLETIWAESEVRAGRG